MVKPVRVRRRPLVVEAMRFEPRWSDIVAFCPSIQFVMRAHSRSVAYGLIDGARINKGDWIVCDAIGKYYVFTSSEYGRLYELEPER